MIDYDAEIECPACGLEQWLQTAILGTLGNRTHYRCRNCGAQWSEAADSEKVE